MLIVRFSWFKPKNMGGGRRHKGHAKIQMIWRDLDFGKTKQFSRQQFGLSLKSKKKMVADKQMDNI